jgi:hypothetical protein
VNGQLIELYQEFVEWIEPETKELDILSLEQET